MKYVIELKAHVAVGREVIDHVDFLFDGFAVLVRNGCQLAHGDVITTANIWGNAVGAVAATTTPCARVVGWVENKVDLEAGVVRDVIRCDREGFQKAEQRPAVIVHDGHFTGRTNRWIR